MNPGVLRQNLDYPSSPPPSAHPSTVGHKRTVSEAIPQVERANGTEQVDRDETTEAQQVIAPAGIRRSGRATKGTLKTKG